MKHFFWILFLFASLHIFAQKPCKAPKEAKIFTNSYQCYWDISELTDTLEATMILHSTEHIPCVFRPSASVSIVKVGDDMMRILDVCNLKKYQKGEKIKIAPVKEPYERVEIPTYFNVEDKAFGTFIYRCNEYDEIVKTTKWGHIVGSDE